MPTKKVKKTKATKETKKGERPKGHPRTWTAEQRREQYLASRKSEKSDYHVFEKDFQDILVPYGHIVLDKVLALGGIARGGRVTQIHGDEGAGKSTTSLWVGAQYQWATKEPIAVFEYEPAVSVNYAQALGCDPDLLFFEHPTNLQDAIIRHIELMEDYGVRFFINDSIPFMNNKISRKDLESGKGFRANFGGHAKGIKDFYTLLNPYIMEYDASLLMVNQTRDRIEDDDSAKYASKHSYTNKLYALPGGRMARFAPAVMLELLLETEIRPWEWAKMPPEKEKFLLIQPRGDTASNFPTANKVRVRSLKNKVTGTGFRTGHIYVRPNMGGLDENMSIRELACTYKLIQSTGPRSWYIGTSEADAIATYNGKTELVEDIVIKENPEIMAKLKGLVTDAIAKDETERFSANVSPEELAAVDENAAREAGTYDIDDIEELDPNASDGGVTEMDLE